MNKLVVPSAADFRIEGLLWKLQEEVEGIDRARTPEQREAVLRRMDQHYEGIKAELRAGA